MTPKATPSLAVLPFVPMHPAWVEQSDAFFHEDPRIFKAYCKVLLAAWRGQPCGSIPSSFTYLAELTCLPMDVVEKAYPALTQGFDLLGDKRFHHREMAALAQALLDRYGKQIDDFAMSQAMSAQAPDLFAVSGAEPARASTKGRRLMPKDFGYDMHPGLREWAAANGYPTQEDQDWVMRRFHDYCGQKAPMYTKWDAAFRNWAENEILYGRVPPSRQPAARATRTDLAVPDRGGAFATLARAQQSTAKGDLAAAENQARIERLRGKMERA